MREDGPRCWWCSTFLAVAREGRPVYCTLRDGRRVHKGCRDEADAYLFRRVTAQPSERGSYRE